MFNAFCLLFWSTQNERTFYDSTYFQSNNWLVAHLHVSILHSWVVTVSLLLSSTQINYMQNMTIYIYQVWLPFVFSDLLIQEKCLRGSFKCLIWQTCWVSSNLSHCLAYVVKNYLPQLIFWVYLANSIKRESAM